LPPYRAVLEQPRKVRVPYIENQTFSLQRENTARERSLLSSRGAVAREQCSPTGKGETFDRSRGSDN